MRGFWVPIGLRALAIFVLGLVLVTAGRRALDAAQDHASSEAVDNAIHAAENAAHAHGAAVAAVGQAAAAQPAEVARLMATLPGLTGLTRLVTQAATEASEQPFVLDGHRLGHVRRVVMERAAAGKPLEFRLTVQLAPDAKAAGCDVAPVNEADFEIERGFTCAGPAASVRVGAVRFEPGGTSRGIRVSPETAKEMATGEPMQLDAQLDGQGGIVLVKDGREKVRIATGANGSAMVVTNDEGKTVRINAQGSSVSVSVDSTGAR